MKHKAIFLVILTLALASLACGININLPSTQVKTGPTVTDTINVPLLADSQAIADVTLEYGAGNLTLQPGAKGALVDGIATYNVPDFKPTVTIESDNIRIKQGDLDFTGIPTINRDIVNDWKLSLGNSPMSLVIKAGAYQGDFELGGLSIERLEITDGAATVNVNFSTPNQIQMSSLLYTTGASQVTVKGLANANTTDMTFRSGAGEYILDFSGELQNNMDVSIESGVSSITVVVPKGVSAQLTSDSNLVSINTSGGWQQNGNIYELQGSGYTITIHAKVGAGSVELQTIEASK
jgi:hypothetical protein